jgi:uncharacterized protein
MGNIDALIGLSHVRSPSEDERFWGSFRAVGGESVVRGDLVLDAHLVALMRWHGVGTLFTHDRDFRPVRRNPSR